VRPAERDPRRTRRSAVAGAPPRAEASYGPLARAAHWLAAALAVIVVSLGWASEAAGRNTPGRDSLLLLHRSLGLTILALMLFRMLWRQRHPAPPLPPALGRLEAALARLTHGALYLIFIIMPLTGYANAAAAGHPVSLFGILTIPPLLPADERLSQAAIAAHLVGQYLVFVLVALHVAAALYHGVIRRDGVLDRMLPRRRPVPRNLPAKSAKPGRGPELDRP
jgi:cytochrome b561